MKWLIRITVPLGVLLGGIFGDIKLDQFLFTLVPNYEWSGFIKIAIVFVTFWLTVGIIVASTVIAGALVALGTEE